MSLFSKIFSNNDSHKILTEVEKLIDNKNYDEAVVKLSDILTKDNLNKKANYLLGIAYYKSEKYDKCKDYFKFASDEFPNSNYYLGTIFSKNKDYKRAISYLENFTKNNNDTTVLEELGWNYLKNNDLQKVLILSDKLKSIRGDISSAYLLAAETYIAEKNYKKAVIEINKLLEYDLENDHAYLLRGKAKTFLKEIEKAIEDFKSAITINKENVEANFYLGFCYSSLKDYYKSIKHLDEALSKEKYKPALELRSEIKLAIDDPDAALSDIETLVKLNPNSTKYLLRSSELKLRLYDLAGSKEDLEKVLKIDSENINALYMISKLEFNEKKFKNVIKYLTRAIAIKLDADILQLRGRAFYHLKDFQSASKDLSKAIDINPELFSAFYFRAKVKEELKDNYGAITDYTKALNDPKFVDAYYSRGKLRLALKEFNAASKDFSKAILLKNNEAVYYYLRAQCYNGMEKTIEAVEDLDKAISINNKFVQAFLLRGIVGLSNRSFAKAKSDFEKVVSLDKRYENHVAKYLHIIEEKFN